MPPTLITLPGDILYMVLQQLPPPAPYNSPQLGYVSRVHSALTSIAQHALYRHVVLTPQKLLALHAITLKYPRVYQLVKGTEDILLKQFDKEGGDKTGAPKASDGLQLFLYDMFLPNVCSITMDNGTMHTTVLSKLLSIILDVILILSSFRLVRTAAITQGHQQQSFRAQSTPPTEARVLVARLCAVYGVGRKPSRGKHPLDAGGTPLSQAILLEMP